MINRTEQEIMKNWVSTENPVVSICCITYNHENYITEAIDSFLMQETDFSFEILIHDDASTDATTKIIKEYEKEYPNIIRTIIQEENQYSKKPIIMPRFLWPIAKGEYFALCEGDDYWLSKDKLQQQVSMMKNHPECRISFHSAVIKNQKNNTEKLSNDYSNELKVYSTQEVIEGGGQFMHTGTIIVKKEVKKDFSELLTLCPVLPVGDYFIQVLASNPGGALFIPELKSVYRVNIAGSWSSKMKDVSEYSKWFKNSDESLDSLNSYMDFSHDETIKLIKLKRLIALLKDIRLPISYRKEIYLEQQNKLSTSFKISWFLIYGVPWAHQSLKTMKRVFKNQKTEY